MTTIEAGKYVIIRKQNGDQTRLVKVSHRGQITVEKLRVNLRNAIGKPFGLFEVKNGNIGDPVTPTDAGGEHLKSKNLLLL